MIEITRQEMAYFLGQLSRIADAMVQLNETNTAIATELMLLRKGDSE